MNLAISSRRRLLAYGITTAITCLTGATAAHASFMEGKELLVDLIHATSPADPSTDLFALVTVGPEVELPGFGKHNDPVLPALVDIDISDASILVTLLIDQPFANKEILLFTDSNNNITPFRGVRLDPSSDWAGFGQGNASSGPEQVTINLSRLSGLAGQKILLHILPEPTTAWLAAPLLLGGVPLIRRAVRKRSGNILQ